MRGAHQRPFFLYLTNGRHTDIIKAEVYIMDLQALLKEKHISKYRLSQLSGVPKTTILDICSGKSEIANCNARTVQKLAYALDCTMEDLMMLDRPGEYHTDTGLPADRSYLEQGLPPDLSASIKAMENSWKRIDSGKEDLHWDIYWCDLNADINSAEVDQRITSEQAWYLRKKYLRMERE